MSKLRGIKLQYMSFCLAVFVIFSTFFYFSQDVSAGAYIIDVELEEYGSAGSVVYINDRTILFPDLADLTPGEVYQLSFSGVLTLSFPESYTVTNCAMTLNLPGNQVSVLNLTQEVSADSSVSLSLNSIVPYIAPADGIQSDSVTFDLSAFFASDSRIDGSNCEIFFSLGLMSYTRLSSDMSQIYQDGYNAGYNDGEASGYISGSEHGFNKGFEVGQDSIDTDSFYQEGYDEGYYDGFLDGSASLDSESVFNDGYNAGYNAAYALAYDDGYLAGYAEALAELDTQNGTSMDAGESVIYNLSHSFLANSLDFDDVNTPFPGVAYVTGGTGETWSFIDLDGYAADDDANLYGDVDGDFDFDNYYHMNNYNISSSVKSLFKADPDVYAYKIIVRPSSVSLDLHDVRWIRPVFGTYSDVMACEGEFGYNFIDGVNQNSSVWIVTDYSDMYLCVGYLSYFHHDWGGSASYSLEWSFQVEAVPYTKKEYNSATAAIEKQTLELKKQTAEMQVQTQKLDDLMNGFDASAGDSMNDDFTASLTDYQTSEDSLFNEAQSGLENFTFVDFSSYPALVTAMTFTTSMMNSLYGAMGGETGPFGIVLSVLFSVMLVSMAIGLYRFYQDKKDGGG